MRHIFGNSTKCSHCYYFREPMLGEKCSKDGFCTNKKARTINGRMPDKVPEEEPVAWNDSCLSWEDADTRLTHYEVMTMKAEPKRKDPERIEKMMATEKERQRAEREELNRRAGGTT